MKIIPTSNIILLKTPFEMDERNQLTFSNKESQFNYFNSLPKLEYHNCTYQRKEGVIRYLTDNGLAYEDLLEYNYCMYQNEAYSNKWFYAYIDNIEYKNDGMSEVSITTDAFQTWQFDISYKRSFVEREHVNDDTIGLHTFPELLEHGEYTNAQNKTDFTYMEDSYIIIALNKPFISTSQREYNLYNGVYSGLIYYLFKDTTNPTYSKEENANAFLNRLDSDGHGEYVESMFIIPSNFAPTNLLHVVLFDGHVGYLLDNSDSAYLIKTITISRPTHVGTNYVPKNNKLFCYPYNYIVVSNNVGNSAEYHYEQFTNPSSIQFKVYGTISPGCSIKAIPLNYKRINENYEESINGAKIPVCSWSSDTYTNWLTQNSVNFALSDVKSGMNIIKGAVTLNPNSIINGIMGVAEKQAQIYEHAFVPNQAKGNTNSSDIIFSTDNSDFNLYYVTIKNEYCEMIDNFFSMFGYKVNLLKVPSITGRSNWNYVKTVDINITGDFPQADLQTIKDMFNKGCTFWHNPETFLDYSQTNSIV